MSKFVKVQTELRDLALIKRSLEDLKLAYAESQVGWMPFQLERMDGVWHEDVGGIELADANADCQRNLQSGNLQRFTCNSRTESIGHFHGQLEPVCQYRAG